MPEDDPFEFGEDRREGDEPRDGLSERSGDHEPPPDPDRSPLSPDERGGGPADQRAFEQIPGSAPAANDELPPDELAPGMPTADTSVAQQLLDDDPTNPPGASRTPLDDRHLAQFRLTFGRVRTALKRRENRFQSYQRRLNQARLATTYDAYLARLLRVSGLAAGGGALLGLLIGLGIWLGLGGSPALGVSLAVLFGVVAGGVVLGVGYYRPIWQARARTAQIDRQLPHGIAYLYALSHGGLGIVPAMQALAESEEEYGELANEFDAMVREMRYLGADPLGAMRSLRDRTPSPLLADFLDDLASTIDSGGDVTTMLASQTDDQFERAKRQQSSFLEQVSLYAELYVGILVVGPIFAIIVLAMMAITGAPAVVPLMAVIYGFVPLTTVAFLYLLQDLTADFESTARTTQRQEATEAPAATADDPRIDAYRAERSETLLDRIMSEPAQWLLNRPERSALFTVPIAVGIIVAAITTGVVEPTVDGMIAEPLGTTLVLGVAPFLAIAVPFGILHEFRVARIEAIVDRFPDTLSQLSSANEQGLTIVEGFDIVARRTGGPLGDELRRTANDMHWGLGTDEAFDRFRQRVPTAAVARTLSLLSDASRYSGNLHRVIDVSARDASSARALELDRRSEMQTYVAIVLISFGLYLLMVVVLESFFIQRIADLPIIDQEGPGGSRRQIINPPEQGVFQTLLFHAALIQSVCAGLVAGELGEDSWRSGLKYSLGLVLVTVLTFVYVTQSGGAPTIEVSDPLVMVS